MLGVLIVQECNCRNMEEPGDERRGAGARDEDVRATVPEKHRCEAGYPGQPSQHLLAEACAVPRSDRSNLKPSLLGELESLGVVTGSDSDGVSMPYKVLYER